MKISKICEVFSLFADITPDEAVKYMPIITAAQKSIESRLRDSLYAEEFAYELEILCGAKVFYDYLLAKGGINEISDVSVKIGGVSTSRANKLSTNVAYAKELYTKYKLLATNLLCDDEFLFGSV